MAAAATSTLVLLSFIRSAPSATSGKHLDNRSRSRPLSRSSGRAQPARMGRAAACASQIDVPSIARLSGNSVNRRRSAAGRRQRQTSSGDLDTGAKASSALVESRWSARSRGNSSATIGRRIDRRPSWAGRACGSIGHLDILPASRRGGDGVDPGGVSATGAPAIVQTPRSQCRTAAMTASSSGRSDPMSEQKRVGGIRPALAGADSGRRIWRYRSPYSRRRSADRDQFGLHRRREAG